MATDTAHRHVEALLTRGLAAEAATAGVPPPTVTDVSGGLAQLTVQGPRSRDLLQEITSVDLSDGAFPFRTARPLDIGCARLLATRITYVGELGYELFVPAELALHVYDTLAGAGLSHGLTHAGLVALGSLRMEKGYRDYGHDLDNLDTLLEAGLGFTADYDKKGGFVGIEHTLLQKGQGPPARRLAQVLLTEPGPCLYHGEVVYRDGVVVGDVRSASYGHTLGGAVGLSMVQAGASGETPVTPSWIRSGTWEVDVAGTRYPARASLRPLYDPKNEKIKV